MNDQQELKAKLVQEAVEDGRKLVTVREIGAVNDIPGADLIKVATIEGWKVVVKAGEFKPGDLCVFFEVDSFLPLDDPRFAFLEKSATVWRGVKGARLRTIRLRKQLSQGLALPVNAFPEVVEVIKEFMPLTAMTMQDLREVNFTGVVGVMKWEQVMNAQLAGQARGNFPSFLRKSDQERAQNMGREIFGYEDELHEFNADGIPEDAVIAMVEKGELVTVGDKVFRVREATASRDTRYEVSIKLDGSSMTAYVRNIIEDGTELRGVCSRNLDLKIEGNENNSFVKMAHPDILELISQMGGDVALQGELMGPGIQGNREGFAVDRFFIYNIFDIKKGEFMLPAARRAWVDEANEMARDKFGRSLLEHVPVLHAAASLEELKITNMDDLLKFAEGPSFSNSVREGLVFKAVDGRHQFKAISNLYLEQEK